jgi:hypothetical protein
MGGQIHPWGPSLPLGAKLRMGLRRIDFLKNGLCKFELSWIVQMLKHFFRVLSKRTSLGRDVLELRATPQLIFKNRPQ